MRKSSRSSHQAVAVQAWPQASIASGRIVRSVSASLALR